MPQTNLPEISRLRTETTIPNYGEEITLEGFFDGTLWELADYLKDQGVVVAMPKVDDDKDGVPFRVRVRFDGVPASIGLRQVADQLPDRPSVLRRAHSIYIIGEPDSEDMVSRVFYVPDEEAAKYTEAVAALATENARISAIGDTLVVRDTHQGIQDVSQLFDTLRSARGQWVVEVQFVELTEGAAEAIGLDWSLDAGLTISATIDASDLDIAAKLATLLDYEQSDRHAKVLTTTRLHVIEGDDAELQIGDTTPVLRRAISDAGTVTTTDVEYIDTGVLVSVSIRTEPDGRLRVILAPEVSQVTGYIGDAPIRSRRRISTAAVIDPGGVVVVGGFSQSAERTTREGLPGLLDTQLGRTRRLDDESTRVYILMRVTNPASQR